MSQVVTLENFRPPDRFDSVPWTQVRIEEASSASGLFTPIDTQTLDPVDADPSAPQLRSFTTSAGTDEDQWYRIVFLDDDDGASLPTTPIQNAQSDAATLLATTADLEARLGITFTDDEEARAETLLGIAAGLVRKAAAQTITLVTDDVLTIRGNYAEKITLPQRPIVDVTAITLNGVTVADGSWYLDGSDIFRGRVGAWGSGRWSSWGCPTDTIVVTYSHGYAETPDFVKATVLEMVVRVWVNPAVVTRETNGSSEVAYAPANGLLLTAAERAAVTDGLRRQAGTIALR